MKNFIIVLLALFVCLFFVSASHAEWALLKDVKIDIRKIEPSGVKDENICIVWNVINESNQEISFDIDSYIVINGLQYKDSRFGTVLPKAAAGTNLYIDDVSINDLLNAGVLRFKVEFEDNSRKIKGYNNFEIKSIDLKEYLTK